jgi:ribosomal protein L33
MSDWITQGIKISYKCRGCLYTFTKNSSDPKAKAHYIKYCRILKKVIKGAKKQHNNRLIAKSSNKIKTTWNVIKNEKGKVHPTEQVPSLLVNSEKLKDPTVMASAFNNFFPVNEKLLIQKFEKGDAISFLNCSFPGNFPGIKIILVTKAEIKSIIRSLKLKDSSGCD